jgi:hypothetical protein
MNAVEQESRFLSGYSRFLDGVFKFVAYSSELLLALGVILSTVNHFETGALFGGSPTILAIWSWTQAIGFEASAGVVLLFALNANQENDKSKRNVMFALMLGLALVGTVMLIMSYVEASNPAIKEANLPPAYDWIMSGLRAIVSVAYIVIGRVKGRRFSGNAVLAPVEIQDVDARLNALTEQNAGLVFLVQTLTEQNKKQQDFLLSIQQQNTALQNTIENNLTLFSTGIENKIENMLSLLATLPAMEDIEQAVMRFEAGLIGRIESIEEQNGVLPAIVDQFGAVEAVQATLQRVQVSLEQVQFSRPEMPAREQKTIPQRTQNRTAGENKKREQNTENRTQRTEQTDLKNFVLSHLENNPKITASEILAAAEVAGIRIGSRPYIYKILNDNRPAGIQVHTVESIQPETEPKLVVVSSESETTEVTGTTEDGQQVTHMLGDDWRLQ